MYKIIASYILYCYKKKSRRDFVFMKKSKVKIVSFAAAKKMTVDDKIREQLIKDAKAIETEINENPDLDQIEISPDLFEKIKKNLKQKNLW